MEAVKSTELPRGRWALGSLKQTEMESAKKSVATRGVAVTEAQRVEIVVKGMWSPA